MKLTITDFKKFMSKDKTRPALCGLAVNSYGKYVVATDGTKLLAVDTELYPNFILQLKGVVQDDVYKRIEKGDEIVLTSTNGVWFASDNPYPKWKQVIPEAKQFIEMKHFRGDNLDLCDKAVIKAGIGKSWSIIADHSCGFLAPSTLEKDGVIILLMPLRKTE